MTHTAHRFGSRDSLANDYIYLMMTAKGFNDKDAAPKYHKFIKIAQKYGAISIKDANKTSDYAEDIDTIYNNAHDRSVMHAVFDNRDKALEMLKALKGEDLGISVVLTGLLDSVHKCCNEAGLKRHSLCLSLGIWGDTKMLPQDEVLDINTMCGHGMVAVSHIEDVVNKVKDGALKPEEAAKNLYERCSCGIFNVTRATELIKILAMQ